MNGEFLIDTNAIVKLLARDPSLRWKMGHNFRCWISFATVGELFAGAHQSNRRAENISEIEHLCTEIPVVSWDFQISDEYGRVHASLRRKGKPIPQNDVWIAATALRHGMTLITLDKHFSFVEHLPIEVW